MKRLLPVLLSLTTLGAMAAPSEVASRNFPYEMVTSISRNGQWMVGTLENIFSVYIRDLVNNKIWEYDEYNAELGTGTQYGVAHDQAVSDNGVVIGIVNDQPSYWENGEWHSLPVGEFKGRVQMGSISRDGSMIVGALGRDLGMDLDDVQFTAPCYWKRNADGSYGLPVFMPQPERDITNAIPQYFTLLSISDDCRTIGAQMTCNYGFPHVPYVYTLGADGQWTYKALALDLINPDNIEFPEFSGAYRGPERPNYELYLTEEEFAEYEAAFPAWVALQEENGYTDEDIEILNLTFVALFMHGEKKAEYEALIDAYLDAFFAWLEDYREYEGALGVLLTEGMDFVFNNMYIATDGSKIYSTGSSLELVNPDDIENAFEIHYAPVVLNTATGSSTVLSDEHNVLISSVADDGSVLGAEYLADEYIDRYAYIFPQGREESMTILEYFQQAGNTAAVKWMEDNLFHDTMVNTDFGALPEERYSMGIPCATPDLSLIAFKVSTAYWMDEPPYLWITYMLNTGMSVDEVEGIADDADFSFAVLPDAVIDVKGTADSLKVYDLAGINVFSATNATGTLATDLPSGIYIIRARSASGTLLTCKAAL